MACQRTKRNLIGFHFPTIPFTGRLSPEPKTNRIEDEIVGEVVRRLDELDCFRRIMRGWYGHYRL